MRTNYKRIKTILNKNFECELEQSRSNGIVFITEDDLRVRIVLTTANSDANEIGIHLHSMKDTQELESCLVDAIQTALKDNFPCIYIHQHKKLTQEDDARIIKNISEWVANMESKADSNHLILKLSRDFNLDVAETIGSMSPEQRKVLMSLIVSSNIRGHSDCRQWHSDYKKSQVKGA